MSAERTTVATERPEAARTRAILIAAFVTALVVRALAAWFSGSAQPQEIRYITIGRGIASGAGYVGLDNRYPDIIQPPLFPMVLALALYLPGSDLAVSRGVSILMGALLVLPAAAIARRLFGESCARRTAVLVSIYPLLAHISSAAITESTFTILVAGAALALWRGLDGGGTAGPRWLGAAGILTSLAYLTRPEGLTYLVVACVIILLDTVRRDRTLRALRRGALRALLPVACFILVALPYLVWVHGKTGQWLMAPKAVLVQVHHTLIQEGQRESWKEPYGSPLFFEHVMFGLNDGRTAIRSHEVFGSVEVGVTAGLMAGDEGDVSLFRPSMAARMVLRNFMEIYLEMLKYGYVMPSVLLLLAGIGVVSRPWTGRTRRSALIVLAFFAGSFSFLLTHVQARFLYPAMPFLLPWIAEGWRRAEIWLRESLGGRSIGAAGGRRAVRALLGVVVLGLTLVHLVPAIRMPARTTEEHRQIGLWLLEREGAGRRVMACTPVTAYYAEAAYDVLPYGDLASVVAYARHRGVDYLVADRVDIPSLRPQLTPLLIPERPHPGLELAHSLNQGTPHSIFLYRVLPASEAAR